MTSENSVTEITRGPDFPYDPKLEELIEDFDPAVRAFDEGSPERPSRPEEPAIPAEDGPAEGASPPILTFCPRHEIRAAIEALARLHVIDLEERSTSIAIEEGDLKPEEADQDWDLEFKPSEAILSEMVTRCVVGGFEPLQHSLQSERLNIIKTKEGLKQILEFLFDHPEIECATPEYFTQDDPAYRILRRKRWRAGETEWTDHDVPYDRPMVAHGLAAGEALLKAYAATSAAVERALAPSRERANNPEAE